MSRGSNMNTSRVAASKGVAFSRSPVLAVRPFTHTTTYWDVYFATNLAIVEVFTEAKYPVPENHIVQRNG